MSSDNKFFLGIILLAVVAIGGVAFFTSKNKSVIPAGADVPNINVTDGHKEGASDSAPVKIVEFGDFQCPFCAQAEPNLRQALKNNSSDVQFIFRNFPLPQHANALPTAYAAEAAGKQGKYFEMHNIIYDRQAAWENSSNPEAILTGYARELGLDTTKFKNDYNSSTVKDYITKDSDYGNSIAVEETPTFFINGKRVTGVQTLAQWQTLIDAAKAAK